MTTAKLPRQTLTAAIAHDLNNVLQAIGSTALVARLEPGLSSTVVALLEEIEELVVRGSQLTEQIGGKRTPTSKPLRLTDIVPIVSRVGRAVERMYPNLDVRIDIEPERAMVCCDPGQVHQLVLNLCLNAAHAMDHAGRVELGVARITGPDDGAVVVSVRDQGIGIGEQDLQRIFEPFYTTRATGEGTGLGLAMVRQLMARHGGKVRISSKTGQGSTFQLEFPARCQPADI